MTLLPFPTTVRGLLEHFTRSTYRTASSLSVQVFKSFSLWATLTDRAGGRGPLGGNEGHGNPKGGGGWGGNRGEGV